MQSESSIVAPPWISSGLFRDIDEQAAQYSGYGQQYQQLSRGPFEGKFSSFNFGDDLNIHFETTNRALAQSASTPPGRYGACVLAQDSPPCALNAETLAQDHVVHCPENKSLEGKTPEGAAIYCLDISCDILPEDGAEMRLVGVLKDAPRSRELRQLLQAALSNLTTLGTIASYPAVVQNFKSSLVDLLSQMTTELTERSRRETRPYNRARSLQVFKRAREYINHRLADGISIVNLCKVTGVSRRSLECVFQSVIGISPVTYIRILQLNLIRRDLMSDASSTESIGLIAARHGVWHWSRFSQYYGVLFGELPSETRLRSAKSAECRGSDPYGTASRRNATFTKKLAPMGSRLSLKS
jgi:AraC family transcriptional regulator, ethanolamine operon transcriptional activator